MKFQIALALISFILLAETCGKEIQLPNQELKKIFGKWEWIETSGGFTGKVSTPAKAGYTEEIEFSKEGIYQKYKNGALTDRKKYSIAEGQSIRKKEPVYIISFSSVDSSFAESLQNLSMIMRGGDTLFLNEECFDCFSSVWVRKK